MGASLNWYKGFEAAVRVIEKDANIEYVRLLNNNLTDFNRGYSEGIERMHNLKADVRDRAWEDAITYKEGGENA